MKLTTLFLFFAVVLSAHGAPVDVSVQCKIVGPVYSGTLDFEPDLTKWKPASECRDYGRGYFEQSIYYPPFILKFNNVTYTSKPETKLRAQIYGGCFWASFKGQVGLDIFEETSSMKLTIWENIAGSFPPKQFAIFNEHESCTVSVNSK